MRADAQRLYRALVLVWARVERVLVSDPSSIPEEVITDAQRLYRALVLVWARVERVLVSDPSSIPEEVITHVSKQLSLKPSVL